MQAVKMLFAIIMFDEGVMESKERVVLGGGCFWCLDAVFLRINGVQSAVSGYMGGRMRILLMRRYVLEQLVMSK